MSGYILSAFADECADDFAGQLAALRELGIPHIELRHIDGKNVIDLSAREVDSAAAALARAGIAVSAVGSPLGKIRADGDMEEHLRAAQRIFAAARTFGARFVRVFSFYPPEGKGDWRDTVYEATARLLDLADGYGVTLCHENEAGIYGESPERCRELLDAFGGRLRAVFDMGNFVLGGYDPLDAYRQLEPYIAYFHIKDALASGAVVPPGCGEAKIREILDRYEKTAGGTVVTLEPHLETFAGLNALAGKTFVNPYRYPDRRTAFFDACARFRKLMGGRV